MFKMLTSLLRGPKWEKKGPLTIYIIVNKLLEYFFYQILNPG